jgi:MoxR-like ATPase
MNFPFYLGKPQTDCAKTPTDLPVVTFDLQRGASAYIADQRLVDAVNVALLLGQPLLVTGEPGTGKTQLAYSLGCELGYDVEKFETKSTSNSRDLFYTYDYLSRFHAAQLGKGSADGKEYITYNALGIAILRSRDRSSVEQLLPGNFEHDGRKRTIVLIDEIDKAPRDFPNDLLNEIDGMYFKIPELGWSAEQINCDADMRPVIVITSNSEKNLPDAFLRRCIYYNIPFPDRTRLMDIILSHMKDLDTAHRAWLQDALDLFLKLREPARGLDKPPATAELLNWLSYLRKRDVDPRKGLREQADLTLSSVSALRKSHGDQDKADSIIQEWLTE